MSASILESRARGSHDAAFLSMASSAPLPCPEAVLCRPRTQKGAYRGSGTARLAERP